MNIFEYSVAVCKQPEYIRTFFWLILNIWIYTYIRLIHLRHMHIFGYLFDWSYTRWIYSDIHSLWKKQYSLHPDTHTNKKLTDIHTFTLTHKHTHRKQWGDWIALQDNKAPSYNYAASQAQAASQDEPHNKKLSYKIRQQHKNWYTACLETVSMQFTTRRILTTMKEDAVNRVML